MSPFGSENNKKFKGRGMIEKSVYSESKLITIKHIIHVKNLYN